ncbi:MAG TPA: type II toxin-antitoxin system HicA family toxin [Verrucomicrobiae bacterium]|jgi:predicted RNA binding protein YcfA (HicA-like mRNA interferase family)
MSGLRGLKYREAVERLRAHGFVFDRQAKGSHEIWYNPKTKRRTTVPHHPGDLPRGTLRAIIAQTGLSVDEFLG